MRKLINIFKRKYNVLGKKYYVAVEKCLSNMLCRRKIKILFSKKDDWEPEIRKGFRSTRHEISFGILSPENVVKYDLIVPLTIEDISKLNKFRHLIDNNPIPVPNIESLKLCNDKSLFNQILITNNFGDFIPETGDNVQYPYILKKKIDEWGQNSHIVLDKKQEQKYSDILSNPDYFRQKVIFGNYEYAAHILFSKQKIVYSLGIEYYFMDKYFIKGKDKTLTTKICHCPYLDIFADILNLIGFEGLCCFNYKVAGNRPLIFEVNPRFGNSLSPFFFSFIRHLNFKNAMRG